MSEQQQQRTLHRGHAALLGIFRSKDECNATVRNGVVQFDGVSQDFLQGWYEELKNWSLLHTEDWVGRSGNKLGEKVSLTDEGKTVLAGL